MKQPAEFDRGCWTAFGLGVFTGTVIATLLLFLDRVLK